MSEDEQKIPLDAAEWHPPEEEPTLEKTSGVTALKSQPNEIQVESSLPELAVEKIKPTAINPIEKVTVGLWQTLGHFDRPTRIVLTLKDGTTADMPWKEAERRLPPEFRIARELGEQARQSELEASDLVNSIRSGTDVMKRSGHIKDALLRPLRLQRPSLRYLNIVAELASEFDGIAQQSFLELRQMMDIRESHKDQIQQLSSRLNLCQRQLEEVRINLFQDLPRVHDMHEEMFRRQTGAKKSLKNDTRDELPELE